MKKLSLIAKRIVERECLNKDDKGNTCRQVWEKKRGVAIGDFKSICYDCNANHEAKSLAKEIQTGFLEISKISEWNVDEKAAAMSVIEIITGGV